MISTYGLHHVTAVTATAKENLTFYTKILGMRLVKKTVNQDDVSAYHLFYADAEGNPGTDMTFFDWPRAGEHKEGTDQISRTYFRVNGTAALAYWQKRFDEHAVQHSGIMHVNNQERIEFTDPEGQRLGLINDEGAPFEGKPWDKVVPADVSLRGFYAVELSVPNLDSIDYILIDILGWQRTVSYEDPQNKNTITVFAMNGGGPGKELYVREHSAAQGVGSTAGSVHHVAFRVKDEEEIKQWIDWLDKNGIPNSSIVDRFYFKSLYFRISQGILFELATDGPGFSADEAIEHLGERLSLPPFLEIHRTKIEAGLEPL